ncbi:Uncharacterised protein [Mycobacteroides abscessus]|nr:Uncharacterised protein [Mycobacteroides abscessus]
MNDVASTASTPGTERRASTSGAVRSSGADTTRSASAYCAAIESFVVWVMTLPAMSVAVTKAVPMTIATPAATRRPMLRRICARVSRNIRRAPPATPSGRDRRCRRRACGARQAPRAPTRASGR